MEKQHHKAGAPVAAAGATTSTAAGKPPGAWSSLSLFGDLYPILAYGDSWTSMLNLLTVRKQSSATPTPTTPTTTSATPVTANLNSKSDVRTAKTDGIKANHTGDSTRDKCVELIYDALAFDSGSRELIASRVSR